MKPRKIKYIKIRNKKNKTKKQIKRKSRFFAGGPKKMYSFRRTPSFDNYETLHDMIEGERKREEEEKMKRIKNANIPFSAFAKKTETEKEIDAFHRRKAVQNLKYLDAVKNNDQYLKNNPESLRQRESGHSVTVYATIDPETGEPVASHKDPNIKPLNLHGERLEENEDWGQFGHDFDGGKKKTKKNKLQRRKTRTRRSIPFRK